VVDPLLAAPLTDAACMARALQWAALGRLTTFPNPRVGCVIVRDGRIVGEGWHQKAGEPHAEVHALRAAGAAVRGATVYVTLEPCSHQGRTPPCADALIAAQPARVVVAMLDPNPLVAGRGVAALEAAGIAVETGLLEASARRLNRGFLSRMERGRPFVTLKLGASLDGRTAMASGQSQWITSEAARADVHRLRAEAGAVLTTSATVLADDPQLSVRAPVATARQPDRIVLDSQARVAASARVWAPGARRLWLCGVEPMQRPADVDVLPVATTADGHLDLGAALAALGAAGVNHVLVESGSRFAGVMLRSGLVDELVLYLAPSLLGDQARGLASLPGLDTLDQRIALRYTDVRQIGPDLKITAVLQET